MNGYDLYEALNGVEDCFIEEAGNVKAANRKGRILLRSLVRSLAACLIMLLIPISAVAVSGAFSSLSGDELSFENVAYLGDGIVEIDVRNDSDKLLQFEENVKLCKFYADEEIRQLPGGKITMEGNSIEPHSVSRLRIDLSAAYDMALLEQPLENDWYYLILTNENFLFGQDWHCSVDFAQTESAAVQETEAPAAPREVVPRETLDKKCFVEDWCSPLDTLEISGYYGEQANGTFSDRIYFAGTEAESVYAVSDGTITEVGFDADLGNYIVLLTENGVSVQYGSLKEITVSVNQKVGRGESIGILGSTGMVAGPTLSIAMIVDGVAVNPLQ